jgi:hypothetical protein
MVAATDSVSVGSGRERVAVEDAQEAYGGGERSSARP